LLGFKINTAEGKYKVNIEKEEQERICFNCNQFFPASMEEATEFGICLSDEAFEPYIEELLENCNYASCQDLINYKKFTGEQKACNNFEEIDYVEIDDNNPLGRELLRLSEADELNRESFKAALLEDKIRNIDWKTMPVDQYVKQLKNPKPEEQRAGISSLGGMISLGNMEAFKELFKFFKQLPPPKTIEEVHFKKEVLRQLERQDTRALIIPHLIDELYKTSSNNTTRQWISDIFRLLEYSPQDRVREPLEKMLKDKRFSYRIKKKIKEILYQ
jgi:hypothetical protein